MAQILQANVGNSSVDARIGAPQPRLSLLFALPTELRIEIYRQCTVFSLVQLSHTCHHLENEINSLAYIYKKSFGYSKRQESTQASHLALQDVRKLSSPEEVEQLLSLTLEIPSPLIAISSSSPTPHVGASLLHLPIELRIEVYTHCTTFALLQLSHTSRSLFYEINSLPSVYQATPGYISNGRFNGYIYDPSNENLSMARITAPVDKAGQNLFIRLYGKRSFDRRRLKTQCWECGKYNVDSRSWFSMLKGVCGGCLKMYHHDDRRA
ncbi:hypothetical protein BJ508DRAFT_320960 [Ascobolus immersus RN42]|uniref:F-box domain-containing protein n=1 Tax=Ascobolus immersus RN42 TaxID=1160509 RepID=A0A3N4IMZ6_ASCIM|nr:hypothetical protein BJ508DRAFT_320960 [Ascobolus immersus RN42]